MMINDKNFNQSIWEKNTYFAKYDLIIIGSGIVGLSTAINYRAKNKKAKILVLERGIFPDGASTKNAGFACFGSAGEILSDLKNSTENTVWETVHMRWQGLQLLRKQLGEKNINYEDLGGFELFNNSDHYNFCLDKLTYLNKKFKYLTGLKNCYSNYHVNLLPFKKIKGCIHSPYEGQLDTGLMMKNLCLMALKSDIQLLNNVRVVKYQENSSDVELFSSVGKFTSDKLIIATNGFINQLSPLKSVKPARAQVLITHPIPNLNFKGSFHLEDGYYYFRNVGNRVLLGGGRNLEFENETTVEQGLNKRIQTHLNSLLKKTILPQIPFEVDLRWSGIMGVGDEKKPIIQKIGKHTVLAVRMGGMGIAIGSFVGKKAAELIQD